MVIKSGDDEKPHRPMAIIREKACLEMFLFFPPGHGSTRTGQMNRDESCASDHAQPSDEAHPVPADTPASGETLLPVAIAASAALLKVVAHVGAARAEAAISWIRPMNRAWGWKCRLRGDRSRRAQGEGGGRFPVRTNFAQPASRPRCSTSCPLMPRRR